MLDYKQFEALILTPALQALQLDSLSLLIAGTIAHESKGGTYIKQINGPALGVCQIEDATFNSLWQSYLPNQAILTNKIMTLCQFSRVPKAYQMIYDMLLSVAMCAALYKWRLDSHKESSPLTIESCADCWIKYYNCGGKGTKDEFINDYKRWIGAVASTRPAKAKAST